MHFVIDFDGTISQRDVFCHLLDSFAPPSWHALSERWLAGEIDARECMSSEVALMDASLAEIDARAAEVPADPHFVAFIARAAELGATAEIVSDGLDRVVLPYIARLGLNLPVTCNRLCEAGERRWHLEFPPRPEYCTGGSGVCKCRVLQPGRHTVLIGDGGSDFCIAGRVDFVLAKGALATHCAEKGYPHLAIAGFAEAIAWLDRQGLAPITAETGVAG